jgi:hypothetical protein
MGQINKIKNDKKTKWDCKKFMVSVTFDVWAHDNKAAAYRLADYLEEALKLDGKKKKYPRIYFEASGIMGSSLDDGDDVLV